MPIDVAVVIQPMPPAAEPLSITMPGGAELAAMPSSLVPDGMTMAKSLLAQANSALAPLNPIFKVMDLALVAVDVLKKIPEAIVNPMALVEVLEKAIKSAGAVAALMPPMSVPLLVLHFIDVLISYLEGLVATLQQLVAFEAKLAEAQAQQDQYPGLQIVCSVAQADLSVQLAAMESGLGPLQKLVRLVNLLMQMVGLEGIPELTALGGNTAQALATLEDALREIRRVRSLIPL